MLLLALAFVLVPLLRGRRDEVAEISDDASNVAIFRAYKRELDEDFARGAITAAERDAAVADLGMRVVAEVPAAASTPVRSAAQVTVQRPWILAGTLSLAMVVAAAALYTTMGTPAGLNAVAAASAAAPAGNDAPMSDQQILAMVDSLARKMAENPGDPKGWILLARSQNALGRFPEAAQAFERAAQLQPGDAQLLADYADVTAMLQQGRFEGKPQALIKQALQADANNMKALALAGTAEIKAGNRDAALKHWQKLQSLVAKDSNDYREIENIIADVKSGKAMLAAKANAAAANAQSQNPAPAVVANNAAAPAGNGRVTGRIMLDPALLAKVAPGDTLFVFARAVNGPKMPLAVLRVPVPKQWPLPFELTDAMAMAPGMTLSSFPQVTIDARISKAGNAQPQPGDLSGQSAPVAPRAADVAVTISRVLP